jgi:prevent-host-death family protein
MDEMTPEEEQAVSATEARSELSDLISRAQYSEERTILTRHDKPVAALVSMEDLRALRKLEDATDAARGLPPAKETQSAARAPVHIVIAVPDGRGNSEVRGKKVPEAQAYEKRPRHQNL